MIVKIEQQNMYVYINLFLYTYIYIYINIYVTIIDEKILTVKSMKVI